MGVTLVLTDAQVFEVRDRASVGGGASGLLPGVEELRSLGTRARRLLGDERCSTTLLRALLVLAAFPRDGGERRLAEVAEEVGWSPGTTHRYVYTWVAVGVLVQDPRSRRYRRVAGVEKGTGRQREI